MFSHKHTHLYSRVRLTRGMHGLNTCTSHNSETLEPLTWSRVCPSLCYKHKLECSRVLEYFRSVSIRHSNRTLSMVLTLTCLIQKHLHTSQTLCCLSHTIFTTLIKTYLKCLKIPISYQMAF